MAATTDDVLVGIFYFIHKQKPDIKLSGAYQKIHECFYAAVRPEKKLNKYFLFRNRGFFPECNSLDQALSNLYATGIISRCGLSGYYVINESVKGCYKRFSEKLLTNRGISKNIVRKLAIKIMNELEIAQLI